MFHEVKIFDKKGKVKKVLSSKKLSKEHWNTFFDNTFSMSSKKGKGRGKKPETVIDNDEESLD